MSLQKKNVFEQKEILVSIILATYRRTDSLEKALQSVINQTYKSIEIIIVSDNANEEWNSKVREIIENLNSEIPIILIENEKNLGSAETRNVGIRNCNGEYVTFIDDDDIYLPNKVLNQLDNMIENNSDYCITDLNLYNEDDKLIEKRERHYLEKFDKDNLRKYHLLHHMTGTDTFMFKKEYLKLINGFPQIDIGDEFYLMCNAIEGNGKFSYLAVCDVKAYVHTNTDGLSSGQLKIDGENALYKFKSDFFWCLNKNELKYLKMRHFAVLAFAEFRQKHFVEFIKYAFLSFVIAPIQCMKLLIKRKTG